MKNLRATKIEWNQYRLPLKASVEFKEESFLQGILNLPTEYYSTYSNKALLQN